MPTTGPQIISLFKYLSAKTGRLMNTYINMEKQQPHTHPLSTQSRISPYCTRRGSHHYRQGPHLSLFLLLRSLSLAPPRTMHGWLGEVGMGGGVGGGGGVGFCRLHNVAVHVLLRWLRPRWDCNSRWSGMFGRKWCKCYDVSPNKRAREWFVYRRCYNNWTVKTGASHEHCDLQLHGIATQL